MSGVAQSESIWAKTGQNNSFVNTPQYLPRKKNVMVSYVYILKSLSDSTQRYVGITMDLKRRSLEHNDEHYESYTKRYAPWELKTYIAFKDKSKAQRFEIYLKFHSGKAFFKKHLL